ncbi:hypothetical protein E2C01_091370 [Portunus trituberculatus]|uniref:Uncharacterized protein n=1 Tax=Portunus trituberculatus TaxID=210409 RepID=A0A5B7JSR4_PORTR|nr:hypothetical protein [Portunus trituberculatus]
MTIKLRNKNKHQREQNHYTINEEITRGGKRVLVSVVVVVVVVVVVAVVVVVVQGGLDKGLKGVRV